MSSLVEELKNTEAIPCSNCKRPMKYFYDDSFPVELTCGHEVCAKCIIKELPQEEAELCC